MSDIRGNYKLWIRKNLDDLGVTFYSEDDLNDTVQDCYDDIVCLAQPIVKTITLPWPANKSYLDFKSLGVSDYMATVAIFNNVSNHWLRDDMSLRDFDRVRRDWEVWTGTPQFWAPHSPKYIAIAPRYTTSVGTFDLHYWATAPVLSSDYDTTVIAPDMECMFEYYGSADLLEQAEQYGKAANYWKQYYDEIEEYKVRCKTLCKSDLLLRI